jgi:hypothetical protein
VKATDSVTLKATRSVILTGLPTVIPKQILRETQTDFLMPTGSATVIQTEIPTGFLKAMPRVILMQIPRVTQTATQTGSRMPTGLSSVILKEMPTGFRSETLMEILTETHLGFQTDFLMLKDLMKVTRWQTLTEIRTEIQTVTLRGLRSGIQTGFRMPMGLNSVILTVIHSEIPTG